MGNTKSRQKKKQCALLTAITKKQVDTIKMILESGEFDKKDERPIEIAALQGNAEILNLLINYGCCPQSRRRAVALDLAVYKRHHDIVLQLISCGIDIHERNRFEETLLYVAACGNNASAVELLVNLGCDINEATSTKTWTPLHVAVQREYMEVTKALLKEGADMDIPDKNGHTPFHLALTSYYMDSTNIDLLLRAGCKVDYPYIMSKPQLCNVLENHPQIKEQVEYYSFTPKPLLELCRTSIRSALGQGVTRKVQELCLPSKLKDYIEFSDLLSPIHDETVI